MSIVTEMKLDLSCLDPGRRLAALRVASDLSQIKLAARAKCNAGDISHFESGNYHRLSEAERYRICEALGVRYTDIFEIETGEE